MVELLMLEGTVGGGRVAIGEHEEWGTVEERAGDAVGNRRGSRAQRRQAGARLLGDFGLRDCRERAAGFGCGQHERQIRAARRVDQIEIGAPARHAEQRAHPDLPQAVDDGIAQRRHEAAMLLRYD